MKKRDLEQYQKCQQKWQQARKSKRQQNEAGEVGGGGTSEEEAEVGVQQKKWM